MAELTAKQKLFVTEYLVDLNATQAAIRAGYSKKTAFSIGVENLKKPLIQAAVADAQDKRSKRVEITQDYVLESLKEVVERSLQRAPVFKPGEKGGKEDSYEWTFNAAGANRALELLGKHLGMFVEKIQHDGGFEIRITRKTVANAGD